MTIHTCFVDDDDRNKRPPRTRKPADRRCAFLPSDMRHFPHVSPRARRANSKFIGAAGEYFVDSLLMRHGIPVWTAPDMHPADRLIEVEGQAIRLQIKTISAPVNGVCAFLMQHGNARVGKGIRAYRHDAFDIAALVVLSHNAVKFVPNTARSFRLFEAELPDLVIDPLDSLEFCVSAHFQRGCCCCRC